MNAGKQPALLTDMAILHSGYYQGTEVLGRVKFRQMAKNFVCFLQRTPVSIASQTLLEMNPQQYCLLRSKVPVQKGCELWLVFAAVHRLLYMLSQALL